MHRPTVLLAVVSCLGALSSRSAAQETALMSPNCGAKDTTLHQLPFSRDDDSDGARFVWFNSCRAGLPYPYRTAAEIPKSAYFTEVDATTPGGGPRASDIVWWPKFTAILVSADGPVVTPEGRIPLSVLIARYGTPHFYRRIISKGI